MDLLKRQLAPVLRKAWERIDDKARHVLRTRLAGRRVVDVEGPFGWDFAAVNLGRLRLLERQPVPEVPVGLRTVLPLLELRTPFQLDLMELDSIPRGLDSPDLGPVDAAASRAAAVEDGAVFHGNDDAGVGGIVPLSPHEPIAIPDAAAWPRAVANAAELLRGAGIEGPYALVLGPDAYGELAEASDDGYPIRAHVQGILGEQPVHAPTLEGGLLLSRRGNDFRLTLGQDLSIGYASHDRERVELYLTESFTFRVLEPAAAVPLTRKG